MLVYEIADTKEGLFSALYWSYKNKEIPDLLAVAGSAFQQDFTAVVKKIETTDAGAKRVENGIKERLRPDRLDELDRAFAAGEDGKHTVIFAFLRLLFDKGASAPDMLNNPAVIAYNDLIGRVGYETHMLRGFIRFKETADGYYYAQIKPVHNVVPFLMPHFCERFKSARFAIHDVRRNTIGLYNGKTFLVVKNPGKIEVVLSDEEAGFIDLWKQYFNNVSIAERKNRRLQDRLMPRRFRGMMDETYEIFDNEND